MRLEPAPGLLGIGRIEKPRGERRGASARYDETYHAERRSVGGSSSRPGEVGPSARGGGENHTLRDPLFLATTRCRRQSEISPSGPSFILRPEILTAIQDSKFQIPAPTGLQV